MLHKLFFLRSTSAKISQEVKNKLIISKKKAAVLQYSIFAAETQAPVLATAIDLYYITVLCT